MIIILADENNKLAYICTQDQDEQNISCNAFHTHKMIAADLYKIRVYVNDATAFSVIKLKFPLKI